MPIFPAPLATPMGTLTSLGLGKEGSISNFGVFATPTMWHSFKDFSPSPANSVIPRTGVRKRYGQSEPTTGGYDFMASLNVEADPDTVGQLWAFATGAQSAPSHNIVATTVGAGGSTLGSSTIPLTSLVGVQEGCTLQVDTAGNAEPVVVASITPTGITTVSPTAHAHSGGVVVTLTSTTAYISKLNFGSLPSFSMEADLQVDVLQYLGCMIDSWVIDVPAGGEVGATFNILGAWEQIKGSAATTPVYSTLKPFSTIDSRSTVLINSNAAGYIGQVGVLKATFNVANNLKKGYRSVGGGRRVMTYPQLQRKVTGTLDLGFESDYAYKEFLGASGATNPQNDVAGISVGANIIAPGTVDATNTLQYAFNVTCGLVKFIKWGAKITSADMITQSIAFEAAETGNQNNDDIAIYLTNAASAIY